MLTPITNLVVRLLCAIKRAEEPTVAATVALACQGNRKLMASYGPQFRTFILFPALSGLSEVAYLYYKSFHLRDRYLL